MQARFSDSTWALLAGLRFALAAIVLLGHLQFYLLLPPALQWVPTLGGRAAVLGFLLLSGVSVGHSYATQPVGYGRRRFLRIYPLYFFAVGGSYLLAVLIDSDPTALKSPLEIADWKTSVANLFFLQGFLTPTIQYNGALWSLGVEVLLYALAPLLSRLSIGGMVVLLHLSLAAFFVPRAWLFGYITLRYCWPWLIGFLYSTRECKPLVVTFLALGVIVTVLENTDTSEIGSGLTFGLVAAVLLLLNTYSVTIPRAIRRALNFLGELSYPLYLFHLPLFFALQHYFPRQAAGTYIILALLVSLLLNYWLDHWLKRVGWVPLVGWVTKLYQGRVAYR